MVRIAARQADLLGRFYLLKFRSLFQCFASCLHVNELGATIVVLWLRAKVTFHPGFFHIIHSHIISPKKERTGTSIVRMLSCALAPGRFVSFVLLKEPVEQSLAAELGR